MTMKIAVTSQNRTHITEHAGKCRKFWVYEVANHQVIGKELLELPFEQSFHESAHAPEPQATHPLEGVSLLITASAGDGLKARLHQKGMAVCVTRETDPDHAVAAWLQGTLALASTQAQACSCAHGHPESDPELVSGT